MARHDAAQHKAEAQIHESDSARTSTSTRTGHQCVHVPDILHIRRTLYCHIYIIHTCADALQHYTSVITGVQCRLQSCGTTTSIKTSSHALAVSPWYHTFVLHRFISCASRCTCNASDAPATIHTLINIGQCVPIQGPHVLDGIRMSSLWPSAIELIQPTGQKTKIW